MRRFAFAAAALAFVGLSAAPALADPLPNAQRVVVSYADLDLRTTAGADAMLERLDAAARRACRSAGNGHRGVSRFQERRACREAAVEAAVASINAPVLTAQYEGHYDTPLVTAAAW